jgi:hypothetical protein
MTQDKTGDTLRTIAIVGMGLTATMNIVGGIGTVCAAFLTKEFPPMWSLLEYQWLYQVLMIVTILLGLGGVWMTVRLIRGGPGIYRWAVLTLVAGTIVAGIQVYASFVLRGKTVPANIKLYTNLFTLIYFLVLRIPSLFDRVRFDEPRDTAAQTPSAGLAAIVSGAVIFTTIFWAGPSHTFQGNNWIEILDGTLLIAGALLLVGGLGMLARPTIGRLVQTAARHLPLKVRPSR